MTTPYWISKLKAWFLPADYGQALAPIQSLSGVAVGAPIGQLDAETVFRASQTLSGEILLPELIRKLMRITLEHGGAERGLLVLLRGEELKIQAEAVTGSDGIEVTVQELDFTASDLPLSMLHHVIRTRQGVVLDDASIPNPYREDGYIQHHGVRSVLCVPIVNHANLIGALYLENNLTPYAFTADRVAVLEMLASQAAISLENARLYADLQQENSDRKRAEENLRRSQAHLRVSQKLGRMGSFVLDPATGFIPVSPELLRILGRNLETESPSLAMLRDYIHPEDRKSVDEWGAKGLRERTPWAFEFRILLPDNSVRFVECFADPILDDDGNLKEYIGSIFDVTDRKLSEVKLKMNETLLSEAQKLGHTGSYILDGPLGAPVWTAEMFRIFEYDEDEGISVAKAIARVHPDDRDRMRQVAIALPGNRPDDNSTLNPPVEYRLLMPDGRVKVLLNLRAQAGPEFAGVGTIIGATMDITDRKTAEEALRRAQSDLAHASRVNIMGKLTATLAHEVNQPITAAVTNASAGLNFLSRETPDLDAAREAFTAIVNAGTRAAQIISRTREFFKKGVPERELVDVDEIVQATVVLLESEARRYAVSIRTWPKAGCPAVMGDRVQLQQVIMNLIVNGIEAMKDVEGIRELAIRSRRMDPGEIVVSIGDTGSGLPSQDADQIFDTFFTTKPDGTGMGLPISRSIVEAHGGRLWAEPNAPKGTIFQFALPIVDEALD